MLQFSEDKAIERPTFPPPPTIDPMGIGDEGDPEQAIDAGELGYCSALDFKCASQRVCVVSSAARMRFV